MTNVNFFFKVGHRWRSRSQVNIFCMSGKPQGTYMPNMKAIATGDIKSNRGIFRSSNNRNQAPIPEISSTAPTTNSLEFWPLWVRQGQTTFTQSVFCVSISSLLPDFFSHVMELCICTSFKNQFLGRFFIYCPQNWPNSIEEIWMAGLQQFELQETSLWSVECFSLFKIWSISRNMEMREKNGAQLKIEWDNLGIHTLLYHV